jgi:wyosine [tRNA(Phe)-imidazoG37] synthetase (radical SAM superfamily)
MSATGFRHVYGPVPSRRLGRSLGIDLVPFKTCTYDCVYCQLGRTTNKTVDRRKYVSIEDVLAELDAKLATGDAPDYISLAGSGEPTLNTGIGGLIGEVKRLTDIPVAILTNGSLLWVPEIQDALMEADLVLPSLDAGDERLFQYVNRPHEDISFERMLDGLAAFTSCFEGEVWLEVLLLGGITGIRAEVERIASIVGRIQPDRIQLNTVSRPPVEQFACPLSTEQMLGLKEILPGAVDIISESPRDEARASDSYGAREADILALLSRRPCTSEDVAGGLGIHVTEALKHLEALVAAHHVNTVTQGMRSFYVIAGPDAFRGLWREDVER